MSELDEKLKLILEDLQDYWAKPERYSEPLRVGDANLIVRNK